MSNNPGWRYQKWRRYGTPESFLADALAYRLEGDCIVTVQVTETVEDFLKDYQNNQITAKLSGAITFQVTSRSTMKTLELRKLDVKTLEEATSVADKLMVELGYSKETE